MNICILHAPRAWILDLPNDIQDRIMDKLRFFAKQANPLLFAKHLQDVNLYRFRIGNYRALFRIENKTIFILKIDRRDKVYK